MPRYRWLRWSGGGRFTTLSIFAAPLDVTISELAVELFFAADDTTERSLRTLLETHRPAATIT